MFVLLLVAYVVLTRVNFLGDMVLQQVTKAVNEQLRAEISISPLEGNPIVGLRGDGLIISRAGDALLSADKVTIDISLPSLFTGAPRVGRLTVDGLRSDYDSLVSLLPKTGADSGPQNIPIDKVEINKSEVSTPWGLLALDDSVVDLRGSEWFDLNLSGSLAEVPAEVNGVVTKKEGNWTLQNMRLKLADGSATVEGSVYPSLDLVMDLKTVDLAVVKKFVPGLAKAMIKGSVTGTMKIAGLDANFVIKGQGTLKNALITGIPMSEVTAEWDYSKNLIDVRINKGNIFQSTVAGIFRLDGRSGAQYLTLDAKISGLSFSDWADKIKDGTGIPYADNIGGEITSLDAHLEGPLEALTGSVSLAPSTLTYKSMQITNIGGTALFTGRPSGDVDFSALYRDNKMSLKGTLSLAKDVSSNLHFSAGSFVLDDITAILDGLEKYRLSGAVSISAVLTGLFGEWAAKGEITSPLITETRYGTFRDVKLTPEYHFKDGSLSFSHSSAEWNGAQVTASGKWNSGIPRGLDFSGTLANAETNSFASLIPVFETLMIDASLSGRWSLAGALSAPTIAAELSAARGSFRGLTIDKFSGALNYTPEKLTLEPMALQIGDGSAKLALDVLFPRNVDGSYLPVVWSLTGKLADIPASALNGPFNLHEPFAGEISGTVTAGNGTGELAWDFNADSKNVSWREFRADEAKGRIFGDSSSVMIEDVQVSFLRGESIVNGKIEFAGYGRPARESALDLTIITKKMNVYELLRRHAPVVRGFQGLIEGSVRITGTLGEPAVSGNGTIAPLRFRSFLLPMVDLEFGGTLREIKGSAKARLRNGILNAEGRVWFAGDNWHAEAEVNGKEINLKQIGHYLPEGFREKLDGDAEFTLKGGGELGAFSGTGTFKSRQMRIMGVDIDDLNAPFYIAEGYAIMEDVKAKSNGGELTGGVALDMGNDRWGGNLTVMGADMATFMSQSVPQVRGQISGKSDFKIRAGGEMGRLSTVRASGVLRVHEGALSGFEAVEAAQKFTRGNPLRFDTVQATFSYDGGFLTILPGSQAIAPKNDPVYRYMMLDGTIDENGILALFAMGKANIQALNALLGALQGLMEMDINLNEPLDKGELLQGFIGGALSGFSRNDFRFTTMGIRGTYDAPRFENIRVESSKKTANTEIPRTSSDPKDNAFSSDNTTFKFRFEIPVGPGASSSQSGLDSQARGQILKNALDSLLKNTDF